MPSRRGSGAPLTPLPSSAILFNQLLVIAGTEQGARQLFQMFVFDLISELYPAVNTIAGPGGFDWGIDTYFGQLDDSVTVWQAKFFWPWEGETQRKQVRDSFKMLIEKSKEHDFKVDAWTLCVPCVLEPLEQKWFDGWVSRNKKHGVRMQLWNGDTLRYLLGKVDTIHLFRKYFLSDVDAPSVELVTTTDNISSLDDALFVHQLEEAGHLENDAAKGLFFAAEALVRDVSARGNPLAVAALQELHLEIQSRWESRFNALAPTADSVGRMAGLIDQTLIDAVATPDPAGINLRPAHRKGAAHRLVEDKRAGWVLHWRAIAASHDGEHAGEAIAEQIAAEREGAVP